MLGLPMYVGELANRLPERPVTKATPFYRKITLRHIKGIAEEDAFKIKGIPESPASDVTLENCEILSKGLIRITHSTFESESTEIKLRDVASLKFSHVRFQSQSNDWRISASGPKTENIAFENCEPDVFKSQR